MSYENTQTFTANVDPDSSAANVIISNRFISLNTAGVYVHTAASGDPQGISAEAAPASTTNDPAKSSIAAYAMTSIRVMIEAGGIITLGSAIVSGANGLAIASVSGGAIVGYAEEAATAAGQIITVRLDKAARQAA